MKAIVQDRYGSSDVLEYADVDRPTPGDDDVLVRVHAAGVDPGVWHLMTGQPYLMRAIGFGLRKPKTRIRGRDVAGQVEAIGRNVTPLQPGDRVFGICEGSFAEYVNARQDRLAIMPANLSYEQAAAVPISALTALHALRLAQIQPGQHVLIIGAAGGIGTYAVQLAKGYGAIVTGVCSTSKTDLVSSIGADRVIDYTREDFTNSARDYDLILDTAGNRPLAHLRRALTAHGTLIIIGGEDGGAWLGGIDRPLRAVMLSPFTGHKLRGLVPDEDHKDLEVLREFIEAGKVTPVIDRTYPLSQTADAIDYLHNGFARGKVVITV
jgi:NADPH:quinone reductase-like Zn-dependent oxidoreductase